MPKFAWFSLAGEVLRLVCPLPSQFFLARTHAGDVREILHTPEVIASPAAEDSSSGALELPERILEFRVAM